MTQIYPAIAGHDQKLSKNQINGWRGERYAVSAALAQRRRRRAALQQEGFSDRS
jgi:hypothetical protein